MSTLTAETMVDATFADDLQISPDGSRVAYVVTPVSRKDEHPASAIWLASTDGIVPPLKLTAGTANDRAPRWSPDGSSLYFLSDRAKRGVSQLYRIALDGGEAEALTGWEPGIDSPAPMPDGLTVAFLAVNPETEEEKKRKEERDDPEVYGERWPFQRLRLLDLDSREVRTVASPGERHIVEIASSPDGSRLAVIAWPTPEIDYWNWNAELLAIDLAGDRATPICRLTSGGSDLLWAPEDHALFFLAHLAPGMRGGQAVFAVDVAGGVPRPVSPDLEACPTGIGAGQDGALYVLMAQGLDSWIGKLDPEAKRLDRLHDLAGNAWSLSVSANGEALAVGRSGRVDYASVWAGPAGDKLQKLTDLNPALEGVAWGQQTPLQWRAPDGLAIEGLLILPPGASREDGPFPLMTLAHGGPYGRFADELQTGWGQWGQWLATAGYAVLLPNPRGGMGRGHDFADRVAGAVGMEDWADVESGIDHLIAEGIADPRRLGIGGWSQGGFMTAWAVGQTRRFKAGIMGAGVSDWGMMVATSDLPHFEAMLGGSTGWEGTGPHRHDALSPISFAAEVTTPVLILHGAEDERVPASQARFFARALREHGVPCELVVYPREPHGIRERNHQLDLVRRVRAWVEQWLGPGWEA